MSETTYVYQDGEIKLTGRTACRVVGHKRQELVEITPANADDGTWKRWVPFSSLFTINDKEN